MLAFGYGSTKKKALNELKPSEAATEAERFAQLSGKKLELLIRLLIALLLAALMTIGSSHVQRITEMHIFVIITNFLHSFITVLIVQFVMCYPSTELIVKEKIE